MPLFANLHPTDAVLLEYYELANRQLGLGGAPRHRPLAGAVGGCRREGAVPGKPARQRTVRAPR